MLLFLSPNLFASPLIIMNLAVEYLSIWKKVFDTVSHAILLTKLTHYGIRGAAYKWFNSYLSQREPFVSVNGHNSLSLPVSCGVPQGSILGPLLFLLYVNDLPNTPSLLKFHLFVDDTNLYFSSKSLGLFESTLNQELKHVAEWMKNLMSLKLILSFFILVSLSLFSHFSHFSFQSVIYLCS